MVSKSLRCGVLVLAWAMLAPAALGDLLDEEDPVVKPANPTGTSTGAKTSTGTGTSTTPKDVKKPEGSIKEPTPHAKGSAPTSSNTTVIPPKKAGKQTKGQKDKEPVHFESKGLRGLREKGMVELVQDVIVTQGEMKMEADHAQVFFDEASHEVIKVVAEGNVKVNGVDENSGEKFRAFGNQGVFLNKERTVVMEGNVKLWRGEDSVVRSKKMTYEMNTGWVKMDRVTGELAPGDKDK